MKVQKEYWYGRGKIIAWKPKALFARSDIIDTTLRMTSKHDTNTAGIYWTASSSSNDSRVVQELLLAHEAIFLWGSACLESTNLRDCATWLSSISGGRRRGASGLLMDEGRLNLLQLLHDIRQLRYSDDRDRVCGLIGLRYPGLGNWVNRRVCNEAPDYSQSVEDLYYGVARIRVTRLDSATCFLDLVDHPVNQRIAEWSRVPAYREMSRPRPLLGMTGSASPLEDDIKVDHENCTLLTHGFSRSVKLPVFYLSYSATIVQWMYLTL